MAQTSALLFFLTEAEKFHLPDCINQRALYFQNLAIAERDKGVECNNEEVERWICEARFYYELEAKVKKVIEGKV
jgi:hypothetical protein